MKHAYVIFVVWSSFLVLVESRAASRECHDKFHNCETWRRSGFCGDTTRAFYLRNGCAKTCGFCKSDTPLGTNLPSVQDVLKAAHKIGQKSNLANIAASVMASHKQNQAASVGFMHHQKLHVPPLPNEVASKSLEGKPECTDRFVTQTCKNWKDGKICMDDRYRKYLTYGCALTCRFCNCRDTYRESPYCDEWKSRGFCDTYKEQLDTYCPKTCGFCINAKYEETTTPAQNATAQPTPSQNATAQNSSAKPSSPGRDETSPDIVVVKNVIRSRPIEFSETGNTNSKRGMPLVTEGNSPLWSVNADTRLTLPQPQQYDDMGGAVRHPVEDGTYFTPSKTNEKFEYYTEHYSPDPYVAAAQREEWMTANTGGNGVAPNPSLSRKSKNPRVKGEKENTKVLKKSDVRHAKHAHKKNY